MKKFISKGIGILCLFLASSSFAQNSLSGVVFRDYNANGQKDNSATYNEPFVTGILVRAFNAANVQVGPTKTTNASGAYNFLTSEIPNGTPVRIEFSGLSTGDYSSFNGTGNASNIQFVTTGLGVTSNFAVSSPDEYWNNITEPNPVLAVVKNKRGRHDGVYAGFASIVQINDNTQSTSPAANSAVVTIDTGQTTSARRAASYIQTGSIFGAAFQQKSQRFFSTAVLKRGHGFGPQGPGGIYIATKGTTYLSYAASFTLEGVTPSNDASVLSFGSVTRSLAAIPASPTAGEISNNNYLAGTFAWQGVVPDGSDSRDIDAFAKVGTMSYGDIEADKATDKLYTINLFQRKLIVLDIENTPTATLNNASAATLSPLVRAYNMTTLPGWPTTTGTGNVLRPYGIKVYKGVGYIGVVNDGMVTQNRSHLIGYVLSFNPNNIEAGFSNILTINFSNYAQNWSFQNHMHPWVSSWAQAEAFFGNNPAYFAQPMIAGFEFNEDESMDIAIRDRWGDQGCSFEFIPEAGTTEHVQTVAMGDLLHATKSGSTWVLENTTTQPAANTIGNAATNSFGEGSSFSNSGKEYYADRSGDGMPEAVQAGITKLTGSQRIVTSVVDPISQGATVGSNYWSTQGVHWNNTITGNKTQWARLEGDASTDKSNGMGDLEYITLGQPIQIGNRIWLDTNGNGIQDAGETTAGVPNNTVITLRSPGVDGIFGNGDDQTWTTNTNANGNYYFSALSSADNRRPTSWAGVGNTLLPGFEYRIEVAIPTGTQLTRSNVATNSVDQIDNDAVLNGTNAVVVFNTSNTNHNFDIGFKTQSSIGDKVWRDDNNDGIQQTAEPGVAGVTVTLFQNGPDGNPGTIDDIVIGTTVTDAYGNYLFDNLTPSTNGNASTMYNVGFTLPANYQFTTQTNTQTNTATDVGNTTTTTGSSTAANGSDANINTGRTGSFFLAAGEADRGADAGLRFTTPAIPNSIGDRVWLDLDGNGIQNGTEPGVAGVTVTLFASDGVTVIATTVTDANGNYLFTGLPANTNYRVGFTLPAGMVFTTKDQTAGGGNDANDSDANTTGINFGKTDIINTGVAGTQTTTVDAGIRPQTVGNASLGDRVWNDINNNGTQDAGEPGIAGVTVNLYQDANGDGVLTGGELTAYATTVTDAFGNYVFNNLPVTGGPVDGNKWQVEFVQPGGYNNTSVPNNNSGNDATDSDITNNTTDRTDFIRLKIDERNMNVDAGFVQSTPAGTLRLGDKVWSDIDADGQQDATEPGVAGVTVKLFQNGTDGIPGTSDDVLMNITTTDINGYYQFVNLAASSNSATNYNVQFENIPNGFSFTTQDAGADATDSDVNSIGRTGSINLTANNQTIDAGIMQGTASGMGSLGNKVWFDLDNDGVQDAGELGVSGVTVNLYRDVNNDGIISGAELTPIFTTITNALGEYMFGGLNEGKYQVGFTLPTNLSIYALSTRDAVTATDETDSDGFAKNTSVAGNTAGAQTSYTSIFPLSSGEDKLTVDLGIVPPANTNSLGGTAWFDANSDGVQGDPGRIAGVMVTLYNNSGVAIATTTTDANGDYLFVGLPDGDYSVGFGNLPAGYDITTKSITNDVTGSDADRINGTTSTVTLGSSNRNDRTLDVGVTTTRAALGNRVWEDLNGDGIQDVGEPGVAGVTVTLWDDFTNQVATTITDANGYYIFPNVIPGNYQLGFSTIPNGMSFTTKDVTSGADGDGANTWTGGGDSDVNPTGSANFINRTDVINFAGGLNLTIDAGLRRMQTATVGNRVWDDINANGVQDAGEPGIPGVIATLYNSANQPIGSAVTGANGEWLITNVPVGTGYYVIFSNKPAGNWTVQDVGGVGTGGGTDNDTDSDVNPSGQTGVFNVVAGDSKIVIDAGVTLTFTLPVKYASFIASKNNNTSLLNFTIAQPATGSTFTVERSITGTNFTAIGTLAGTNATSYTYTDVMPILTARNYYRIKEVDAQGKVSYSEIRMVKFTKDGKVDIYPIPAATNISITFGDEVINKPIVISIYNQQGQELMRKQISRANATEVIDIASFANGTYQLRVTSNTELITNRKVVIMK